MLRKISTGCFVGVILLSNVLFAQGEEMPKPETGAVWKYITQEHPFTEWAFWPDHQGTRDSNAPHSPKHKIYVNKQALESTTPPLQYGSMVIKHNLSPADEIKSVTIMYKVKDYNPSAGDWFWAQYSPTGEVQEAGKPEKCIACHTPRADNDYILVHKFEEMPKPETGAVWKYITQEHPFTEWAFWPDHNGTRDSNAPHSPKHKIYVNKQALESTIPPLQYGSMVIKHNLSPADEIKSVTIMYKVKDYNPSAGDWFWAQYSPTGEVQEAGKPEKCIACHTPRADNDYILVHEFDK